MIRDRIVRVCGIVAAAGIVLAGCSSTEVKVAHAVPLAMSLEAVPEPQLLDVGIRVFDPGVPEGEIDREVLEELLEDGTFVQIRRTESMYMAIQLRDTVRRSGHWGAVWVTPTESTAADLNVTSEILHSDGDLVRLHVVATDATGRAWLDDHYELETAASAYNRQRYPDLDPYQDVFNSIANDLATARASMSASELEKIRTVGQLRYAGELSPEAFAGYVEPNRDGIYEATRLPADDDPMYARTLSVRQRERLFFDTLDQHYESFSSEAAESYDGWREYAREEAIAIRDLTRQARWRTGLGIATIVASILYGQDSDNDSFSNRIVRDAMMYVGADMLRSSSLRRQERRLHTQTLEELSESFNDEVAPLVVDIAGTQHRLTGTAEVQYSEWRELLRELFIDETGFVPESMDVYAEPVAEPAAAELEEFIVPVRGAEATSVAGSESGSQDAGPQEAMTDASGGSTGGA
jgi:hypothetical protein